MNSSSYKSSRVASPSGHFTMPSGVNGPLVGTKLDQSTTAPVFPSSARQQSNESLHFDPFLRLKIEKLESAMKFLGLQPTPEQQLEMRHRLRVDTADETVAYRDFVSLAQEMFTNDLQKINFTTPLARNETEKNLSYVSSQSVSSTVVTETELKSVSRERDKAKVENGRLQALLHQKNLVVRSTEDELLRVREELQNAMEEGRSLRSRLRLAEEAQRAARRTEEDYEEVLRMLEAELLQARQQEVRREMPDDRDRLTELEYRLRKTDVDRKMYEVATERLLRFTTTVGENLTGVLRTISKEVEAFKGPSGDDLNRVLPRSTRSIEMLAAEARSTTKAVRSLLEIESISNGVEPTDREEQKLQSRTVPHD